MTKVLVLGAQGMLGSTVASVLRRSSDVELTVTTRNGRPVALGGTRWRPFDAEHDSITALLERDAYDWIVNGIAVLAARIDERADDSVIRAIEINAVFPRQLAKAAERRGQRVIQIATDGVYSGLHGPYDESAPHDATDVYGKSKSLGEAAGANVALLRCSIIGPESGPPASLLGWLLAVPSGTTVRGFTDQRWNGITTLHFAKLCGAMIAGTAIPGPQHVVPSDSVTKSRLLALAARAFGRDDLSITAEPGPHRRDRTLATRHPDVNRRLWQAAGYPEPPSIANMLDELAAASG